MAITRERIARAVENYLPSSLTVSQDRESAVVDSEEVFSRLQSIVSTALALDPNSVFYLVSIVLGEALGSSDDAIAGLVELSSQDVLLSSEQSDPRGIESTEDLRKASSSLSGLSGSSSSIAVEEVSSSITSFQSNQLSDLVQRRNAELVREDIKKLALQINTALDSAKVVLDRVSGTIEDYEEVDVKAVALTHVATTAKIRIAQIIEEISNSSPEEHASLAEDILVDLSAAKIAIKVISDSTNPRGSIVVPSTTDGATKQTYLTVQGRGSIIPRSYVSKGPSGDMFLDYILASSNGTASSTEQGVVAQLKPEEDLVFPLTFSEDGNLNLVVNGVGESIPFAASTFNNQSDLASYINSVSSEITVYVVGGEFAFYAYSAGSNPVGSQSSIEVESSSSSVLSTLKLSEGTRSVGSLTSNVLVETNLDLSTFTFPTKTTVFGDVSVQEFTCFVTTLDGETRRIAAVDSALGTITVSPGIPLARITNEDGTVSFAAGPFRYVVTKSFAGTLFESGNGGNTTPSVSDRDGTSLDSFLVNSSTTGSTDSTRVRNPNSSVQATATIEIDSTLTSDGDTVTINGIVLTARVVDSGAPNTFLVGSDEETIAQNLSNAINLASNDFTRVCTSIVASDTLTLTAAYSDFEGAAGNAITLTTSNPSVYLISGFSGGVTRGSTWDGLGEGGALETITRATASDGTNKKESGGSGKVGRRKTSGTGGLPGGGVTYKGYGSETGVNWYAASTGQWGVQVAASTGSIGDSATPSTSAPTNLFAFDSTVAADWATNTPRLHFNGTGASNIAIGNWFVLQGWAERTLGDNEIRGPYSGVGPNSNNFPSPPHYQGIGGTSFYINSNYGGPAANAFNIIAPNIDEDGDGTEDGIASGDSWADMAWIKSTISASTYLTMFGYVFNPDKFKIVTAAKGFTQTYTAPSGAVYQPQNGDTVFYEWESGGVIYRNSQAITGITGNLECDFASTGGTGGENDFTYRIDDPWKANSPQIRTGLKYTFVRNSAQASKRFYTNGVNLTSANVAPGDLLYISTAGSNQGWYVISSIDSYNELSVSGSPSGTAPDGSSFKTGFAYPQDVSWEIRDADYAKKVSDSSATFISNGVSAGDTVTIISTAPSTPSYHGDYEVASVESETALLINTNTFLNIGNAGVTVSYRVPQNDSLGGIANHFFRSPSSSFYGKVFAGDILNVGSTDYEVESIESADTLKIKAHSSGPSTFASYFDSQVFTIRRGLETSGTYAGQETTNAFKISLALNSGLTDLKDVNGIEVANRINLNPSGDASYEEGYLKIKSGAYAGTYAISSVSASDGGFQYVYIDTYLPVTSPLTYGTTWETIAGNTTATFTDSSASFLSGAYTPKAGDSIRVEVGSSDTRFLKISSVRSSNELTLEEKLPENLSSLSYSVLPSEYPQIGNELVVGTYRSSIQGIRFASDKAGVSKAVLELSDPLPLTLGGSLPYFVVTAGGDPFSTLLEDDDPSVVHDEEVSLSTGFKTSSLGTLDGLRVQLSMGKRSVFATIDSVPDATTLRLTQPIEFSLDNVSYRVVSSEVGSSKTLTHPSIISTEVVAGDYLSMWQVPLYREITSKTLPSDPNLILTNLNFTPQAESGLSGIDFAVTRGGSPNYGKYLLLQSKIKELKTRLDAYDFSDLNLRLGEVLSDRGLVRTAVTQSAVTSSSVATAPDDGDGDLLTNRFDVSVNSSQNLDSVRAGDRISVTYREESTGAEETRVCWVVLGDTYYASTPLESYDSLTRGDTLGTDVTRCLVSPEIPLTSTENIIISWTIERSSISFALFESFRLRALLEEVRGIVSLYSVDSSESVDSVLSFLESEGYDRLADLLRTGQIKEFFGSDYTLGSYQDLMSSAIREAGGILLEIKNG